MVDLSKMTKWDMGKLFDFSVLPKQSTEADIRRGCQIAKEYNCKAFCFSSSEWTPTFIQLSSTVAPKRTASAVSKALTVKHFVFHLLNGLQL